ncbi:DinB family protein [Psychrobacillus psychrodurans]|uniref:DinB family protein n=1 Tax=Psychrobacillus psychrodurans TaxID=126157 RepID=A0A9X3LDU8_9BACI|nr:DinB family protein [Psychrobacillus psychrodurans]MCZ8534459.1 DinB family protein [Psychrobacillus psychrodurans]
MIHSMISQLTYVSDTITQLFDYIDEKLLSKRPIENKMTVWEVCVHLAQIPQADLHICKGYNVDEMRLYYEESKPVNIQDAKEQFLAGIQEVVKHIEHTEEVLSKEFTTYWGSEYRTGEWFLQIMNHLVHHRMQLYSYLLVLKVDVQVVLFR